jgi:pSer/pThr/pTyr-binding forkhead associated (FHA) protein
MASAPKDTRRDPRAFLKVVSGTHAHPDIPLPNDRPFVIGRKRGDYILEDGLASATHAQILPDENGWMIRDLGSTNGTLVDGRLVREAELRPGAEITIGKTRFVLFVGLAEEAEEEQALEGKDTRVEIAWFLEEELLELEGSPDRTESPADMINLDLRLPPGLKAVVEVVAGQDAGKVFRLTRGNISIGRKLGEVPLTDIEVSRRHSAIEVFGREMIFLRDLGSTNGTYHNGRRIEVSRLKHGDTIGIGQTVLKLQIAK